MYRRLKNYVDIIRERTDLVPGAAIVLGSGLGAYGERIRVEAEIPYSRLEGFPVSTVAGHQGCRGESTTTKGTTCRRWSCPSG